MEFNKSIGSGEWWWWTVVVVDTPLFQEIVGLMCIKRWTDRTSHGSQYSLYFWCNGTWIPGRGGGGGGGGYTPGQSDGGGRRCGIDYLDLQQHLFNQWCSSILLETLMLVVVNHIL